MNRRMLLAAQFAGLLAPSVLAGSPSDKVWLPSGNGFERVSRPHGHLCSTKEERAAKRRKRKLAKVSRQRNRA